MTQGEFAQLVVAHVGLERQERRRVHGGLQQVARQGDFGAVEQRLVRLLSNDRGNVLRRDQTLPGGCEELAFPHTRSPSVTSKDLSFPLPEVNIAQKHLTGFNPLAMR